MIRYLIFLQFLLSAASIGHAQSTDNGQALNRPGLTDRNVEGLLKVDQQRLNLTPDQTAKAKVVLDAYAAKFNEMAKNAPTVEDYKAGIRTLDRERISKYKTFLNSDQYAQLVATYNKFHPKTPITP
jgi:hypothetical protein